MLAQHVDIGLGDCVRIEGAVRLVGRIGVSRAAHAAINNEMGDVNALGPQLARRALRQSAQSFPMAKAEESANPLTLAVAPVSRMAPRPRGTMRFAACWVTRKPPKGIKAAASSAELTWKT
jgi:hypothetical protein